MNNDTFMSSTININRAVMEKVAMLSKTAANFATLKECWAINKPIKKVKIAEVDDSSVIFAAIIHEMTMFDRLKEVHTKKKIE